MASATGWNALSVRPCTGCSHAGLGRDDGALAAQRQVRPPGGGGVDFSEVADTMGSEAKPKHTGCWNQMLGLRSSPCFSVAWPDCRKTSGLYRQSTC